MCFKCGWRNCRRVHPRRCLGAGGPCAVCGMTSHATRYHDEFEAYIRERRPRPPTEPEGEEIEAMMTALGLNSPPAAARALPAALPAPGLAAEPVGLDFDAPRFPNWPDAPPPQPAPRAFTPTPFLLTPGSVSTPPPPRREIDEPPTPYRPEPAAEAYAAPPPLPSLPTEEGL